MKRASFVAAVASALFAGSFFAQTAAAFTVAVSPSRIEDKLTGKPSTHTLKIINYGTEPTTLSIRVANFDLDEANKVREIAPTANSLDRWILVRPLQLTIEAGKSATVRLAIRPMTKPADGEHRAMIFIEQNAAPDAKPSNVLNVSYEIGVAIYAQSGVKRIASRLHAITATADGLALDVESRGNAHSRIDGNYAVWPADKMPDAKAALAAVLALGALKPDELKSPAGALAAGALPGLPVLPGARRTIAAGWPAKLSPGRYQAAVIGRVGELEISQIVAFTVPAN